MEEEDVGKDGDGEAFLGKMVERVWRKEKWSAMGRVALARVLVESRMCGLQDPFMRSRVMIHGDKPLWSVVLSLCEEPNGEYLRSSALEVLSVALIGMKEFANGQDEAWLKTLTESVLRVVVGTWADSRHAPNTIIRTIIETLHDMNAGRNPEIWIMLLRELTDLPQDRKGKYVAMSALVPRLGARAVLAQSPTLQTDALSAMMDNLELASVVTTFLAAFWKTLWKECTTPREFLNDTYDDLFQWTYSRADEVDRVALARVQETVVAEYCRAIEDVTELLGYLRGYTPRMGHEAMSFLVAVLHTLTLAHRAGRSVMDDYRLLLADGVEAAEVKTRCLVLEVAVYASSSSQPMGDGELSLVERAVRLLLAPGLHLYDRSAMNAAFAKLTGRIGDSVHAATTGGGWWDRERKRCKLTTREMSGLRRQYLDKVQAFLERVVHWLHCSMAPCCCSDRMLTALTLLNLIWSRLDPDEMSLDAPHIERSLWALLGSEWDRVRNLAMNVLRGLRRPLPCEASSREMEKAVEIILNELDSPRIRDIDPAAMRARLLVERAWRSEMPSPFPTLKPIESWPDDNETGFLGWILENLRCRAQEATTNFSAACDRGLFAGGGRLLRYAMEAVSAEVIAVPVVRDRIMATLERCKSISLRGIGFHEPNVAMSRAVFNEDIEFESCELTEKGRKLVISSFLSAQECSSCVAGLMDTIAKEHDTKSTDSMKDLMSRAFRVLMDIMKNTRHSGAIEIAGDSLERLAKRATSSVSAIVRKQPSQWLDEILQCTKRDTAYVLRRSAGLPFMIVAILRAEDRKGDSQLLRQALEFLLSSLELLIPSIDTSKQVTINQRDDGQPVASCEEIECSHCSNILRKLFLDGRLTSRAEGYVTRGIYAAIAGMRCNSWLIRNSSSLLFSAILSKMVPRSQGREAGISERELFSRFPRLLPFLQSELKRHLSKENIFVENPALFAVLHIFSSLKPSIFREPNATHDLTSTIPLLFQLLGSANESIRIASSRALASCSGDDATRVRIALELLGSISRILRRTCSPFEIRPLGSSVAVEFSFASNSSRFHRAPQGVRVTGDYDGWSSHIPMCTRTGHSQDQEFVVFIPVKSDCVDFKLIVDDSSSKKGAMQRWVLDESFPTVPDEASGVVSRRILSQGIQNVQGCNELDGLVLGLRALLDLYSSGTLGMDQMPPELLEHFEEWVVLNSQSLLSSSMGCAPLFSQVLGFLKEIVVHLHYHQKRTFRRLVDFLMHLDPERFRELPRMMENDRKWLEDQLVLLQGEIIQEHEIPLTSKQYNYLLKNLPSQTALLFLDRILDNVDAAPASKLRRLWDRLMETLDSNNDETALVCHLRCIRRFDWKEQGLHRVRTDTVMAKVELLRTAQGMREGMMLLGDVIKHRILGSGVDDVFMRRWISLLIREAKRDDDDGRRRNVLDVIQLCTDFSRTNTVDEYWLTLLLIVKKMMSDSDLVLRSTAVRLASDFVHAFFGDSRGAKPHRKAAVLMHRALSGEMCSWELSRGRYWSYLDRSLMLVLPSGEGYLQQMGGYHSSTPVIFEEEKITLLSPDEMENMLSVKRERSLFEEEEENHLIEQVFVAQDLMFQCFMSLAWLVKDPFKLDRGGLFSEFIVGCLRNLLGSLAVLKRFPDATFECSEIFSSVYLELARADLFFGAGYNPALEEINLLVPQIIETIEEITLHPALGAALQSLIKTLHCRGQKFQGDLDFLFLYPE
uniref:DUF2428 domain-containing protein n=1 Tax=Compsopogon caeruleus TaxID=31354 RepID=A0A7S1XDI4_9RHOD